MLHSYRVVSITVLTVLAFLVYSYESATLESNVTRLTNTPEQFISLNPTISDDGSVVTFESSADLDNTGTTSFHAVRSRLSTRTFESIASTRMVSPALSVNGEIVAFASSEDLVGRNQDRNSEIFLFSSGTLSQITDTEPEVSSARLEAGCYSPSLSLDGRFVVFSSNRDLTGSNSDLSHEIYLFDNVLKTFKQVTNTGPEMRLHSPKISGDGTRIVFAQTKDSNRSDIVVVDRASQNSRTVFADIEDLSIVSGRAVSNDGNRIVYQARTDSGPSQVFLFDVVTGINRQLTQLGSRATDVELQPTISGDGKRVAFSTRRRVTTASDGSVELYLLDIPTGTIEQVTSAPAAATAQVTASLNRDGSIVAFSFPRVLSGTTTNESFANNSEIYLAATTPRPAFGVAKISNAALSDSETALIARGSIARIKGNVLAYSSQSATSADLPVSLAGTTVRVAGISVRLFHVSPEEVTFVVPDSLPLGPANFVVTNPDGYSSIASTTITDAAPGLFIDGGSLSAGVVLNSTSLTAGPFDPSDGHLHLSVFATGVRHGRSVSAQLNGKTLGVELIAPSNVMGLDEIHLLVDPELRGSGVASLIVNADGQASNAVSLTLGGSPLRDLMINEFLADPADGVAGDANHDGVRSSSDDEFVELVNPLDRDLDISNWTIRIRSSTATVETIRHRFSVTTIISAGSALVVFGGGNPDPSNLAFGGAQVTKASGGGFALSNTGGVISVYDGGGSLISSVSYGAGTGLNASTNQSLTRTPDVSGQFALHSSVGDANGALFSPGTRTGGAPFLSSQTPVRVLVLPAAVMLRVGETLQLMARAFDSSDQEIPGVIFRWTTSNSSVVTISQSGVATGIAAGSTSITATARNVVSDPTQVEVFNPTPSPTPTPTPTLTPSPSPTATPSPSPSPTPVPSPSPTPNPTPTTTPTPSPSPSPSPTPTPTPSPSPSPTPTPIPSPSPSPTPSPSPSPLPSPSPTPSPTISAVVVSQIFGGGGNAGAPFQNDFIELFNRGNLPVNLNGWSIQYSGATSSTWAVTALTNVVLQPGQRYLIRQASGGSNGMVLPTPDAAGSIAMAATAGKVALVKTSTPLTGACPANPDVVDLVGYGSSANCFKATPAAAPSNALALLRKNDGCVDSQNNGADFATGTPNPRNTQSPITACTASLFAYPNWLFEKYEGGCVAFLIERRLSLRRSTWWTPT